MRLQGPAVFWYGSLAAASATAVGHFPWFYTFNQLQAVIPQYSETYKYLFIYLRSVFGIPQSTIKLKEGGGGDLKCPSFKEGSLEIVIRVSSFKK